MCDRHGSSCCVLASAASDFCYYFLWVANIVHLSKHNFHVPQACLSMRGSDRNMVENRVIVVKVVARLRAQFFSHTF